MPPIQCVPFPRPTFCAFLAGGGMRGGGDGTFLCALPAAVCLLRDACAASRLSSFVFAVQRFVSPWVV